MHLSNQREVGPVGSLGFVFNPTKFLGAAPHSFFLGGRRVRVVRDREEAAAILASPAARFFNPGPLKPWLGEHCPLWLPAEEVRKARARMAWWVGAGGMPDLHFEWAPRRFELVSFVRHGLVEWAVEAIIGPGPPWRPREAINCALAWLDSADTPALVIPPLRRISPTWCRVPQARSALISALGLAHAPAEADSALLLILAAADAPAMLIASALSRYECNPQSVEAAIRGSLSDEPPVPLILRELAEACEFGKAGDALGIDTRATHYPFGGGAHACLGRGIATHAAEHALQELIHLGYAPASSPVKRRVRLTYGTDKLWLERRGPR